MSANSFVTSQLDQVILVDEHDQEIGVMDKVAAHRGEAQLHRAISVFLFNDQGELLIQQRSPHKIVGAGQWANTCCGNVRPGESYQECALRRLKEELGIEQVKLNEVIKFSYQIKCNEEFSEKEMDAVFVGAYNGQVIPNSTEVANYEWKNWPVFKNELATDQNGKYAPWIHEMAHKKVLQTVES